MILRAAVQRLRQLSPQPGRRYGRTILLWGGRVGEDTACELVNTQNRPLGSRYRRPLVSGIDAPRPGSQRSIRQAVPDRGVLFVRP